MKSSRVRLNLFVVLLPLIVLFVAGGFVAYNTWGKYVTISELQLRLDKISMLQSLENAVYKEVICATKVSGNKENLKDQCKQSRENTDAIVSSIENQSNNIKFYQKIDRLFLDKNSTDTLNSSIFGKDELPVILQAIRYNMDTSQNIKLDKFINSEYYKKIIIPIKEYWENVKLYSNEENRAYLDFLNDMNRLYTYSITNTIFGTYFLSNKKIFTAIDLMNWDKYMSLAVIPDIDRYKNISPIKDQLKKIFDSKSSSKLIDDLDKISIDILLGYSTGNYEVNIDKWIFLNGQKESLFVLAETTALQYISEKNLEIIKRYEMIIIGSLTIALLSMIFFVFTAIGYFKRVKEENEALKKMMQEIEILTAESKKEVLSSEDLISDFSDKKQIYIYISSILKLLHEKELQAGEANNAKDLFLANMSHEIRTPLNGIVGFTQLLKESPLTDDQKEFINIIENSSDNLLTIVNDILDLSKISANKMELEQVSFDLFEKIESAIETFAAKADEKDIELGIYITPTLSRNFIGDPTKLSQVFTNLISNALKFTPDGGVITLFAEEVPVEDENEKFTTIRFAIKDSGIGISEEQKKNIFQAFTQADSSTSRKFGGTGLGLTISQAIIDYMGGRLDVNSKENEGSEFFFSIKLEKDLNAKEVTIPNYKDLSIGLALPDKEILRQVDISMMAYMEYFGSELNLYSYDELFNKNRDTEIPDILFIDQFYIKNLKELKVFEKVDTNRIFMTTSKFKSMMDIEDHNFLKIVHKPMTISKVQRVIDSCISDGEKTDKLAKEGSLKTDKYKGIKALVAEDNIINQKLILATLENFGLSVKLTSNGKEAFEERQREDYDIIFMDVQMPVMNGMEATQAILEYETEYKLKHIPIIALTANALKGDREKYIDAGMDNYASKPLNLEELKGIIDRYFPDGAPTVPENIQVDKQESEKLIDTDKEFKQEPTMKESSQKDDTINDIDDGTESPIINILEDVIEDKDDKPTIDLDNIKILLYNQMKLQSNIYRSIFKGLGYDVEIVTDDDSFLDALEEGNYTYAMYDAKSFNDMACSVADIARDAGIIPIMFIEEEREDGYCTKVLKINSDRETIKAMLEDN
ncbi:BarA sensory histidine kinase (= VarS = GacS) [hydrothermal vent metagenome]|uniref:histidine kinase n=1 Tax=hydrothermal vent metagenome TaxID=652676 RepID=A0A1W1BTX0_9ZZZZ